MSTASLDGSIYAIQELLKYERFVGQIYEPCRRDEGIGRVLVNHGNPLFTTSLDFLEFDCSFANVVGEPDLGLAISWTNRALELVYKKVAFLLPLRFLEGKPAKALFEKTPLVGIYVITRRLPGRRGTYAWFVWEKGNIERPFIRWI